MAKGVPHALSGRRPKKPIIRPKRVNPKVAAAQAAAAAKPAPKAAAPAPKPAAPKPAAPKPPKIETPKPSAPAPEKAPLELLEGSVSSLKDALETGKHDAHLQALLDAEKAGKGRKTALDAISDRMD